MPDRYRELIVKGDDKLLRGFVRGYQLAKRLKRGLFLCRDHPIDTHHLKDVLHLHRDYIHILCTEKIHPGIAAAIRGADDLEFEIVADKPVARLAFQFKFNTASTKVGTQLKRMFSKLPAGLSFADYDPHEEVDPSAKGPEFYSPAHHYRFHGDGEIEGDLDKLEKFRQKLADHEFVDVEAINIYHAHESDAS